VQIVENLLVTYLLMSSEMSIICTVAPVIQDRFSALITHHCLALITQHHFPALEDTTSQFAVTAKDWFSIDVIRYVSGYQLQ
jgi:hypothetical protein